MVIVEMALQVSRRESEGGDFNPEPTEDGPCADYVGLKMEHFWLLVTLLLRSYSVGWDCT